MCIHTHTHTYPTWRFTHLAWWTQHHKNRHLNAGLELIMLILGESFRFASAKCAEVFRWVILWVQHRSKWASPDMFAYVLLVDLVRTLNIDPLILSRARWGFSQGSCERGGEVFAVRVVRFLLGFPLCNQDAICWYWRLRYSNTPYIVTGPILLDTINSWGLSKFKDDLQHIHHI